MSKVLVLGGSGFVGSHLVPVLLANGHEVTLLNRGNKKVVGVQQLFADRADKAAVEKSAGTVSYFDTVVDTSAYRIDESEIALKAFNGKFGHWIHLSSAAVYKETPGRPPRESDLIGGAEIWGSYGLEKSEVDQQIIGTSGISATILRPPYLYGPRNDNDRETFIWSRVLRSEPVLVPGNGTTPIQFLHVSDLVDCIFACMKKPAQTVSVYNVAGNDGLTTSGWVRAVANAADLPDPSYLLESRDLDYPPRKYFPFRNYPCEVDTSKIENEIGWKAKLPFLEGSRQTFSSYSTDTLKAASPRSQIEIEIVSRIPELAK